MLQALLDAVVLIAKIYFAFMVICMLGGVFMLFTMIGDNTMVNDTIRLSPGNARTYTLPPGMTWINVHADSPVNSVMESLTSHGMANGVTDGTEGHGTMVPSSLTITNPGNADANVSLRISTGMFNPFGYMF